MFICHLVGTFTIFLFLFCKFSNFVNPDSDSFLSTKYNCGFVPDITFCKPEKHCIPRFFARLLSLNNHFVCFRYII